MVLFGLLLSGRIRQVPSLWRHLARFRKERKPRALDVMWDLSIMAAIAAQAGLPLFVLVDDFAEFFYQFRLASRCLWYCGIVMLDPEVGRLWCIVEKVLAMGFTPSRGPPVSVRDRASSQSVALNQRLLCDLS